MIGQTISHYSVIGKLGAGGMGEVYRAQDTKLNREVAIKVLPEGFAQDAERLARFQREAQVLASLNHPNIAAIYGLEESDGIRALVMELVEGPTLADRIAAGPIPVDEALAIAKQIADALEVAHERGIIHRDLKPANVKVTPDDTVKVLDFGLAKISSNETPSDDLSHSPTMLKGTQAGMILGTAAYMSPEQAKGKAVDKRSDIWAFGCVLFEMLSGKQTFSGETLTDTLAAVVRAEPEWNSLPQTTPLPVRRLLRRCLTKDPKQRLRDIGEAQIAIEKISEASEEDAVLTVTDSGGVRRRFWFGVVAGVAATVVIALALVYGLWPRAKDLPVRRFSLDTNVVTSPVKTLSISPDGEKVAFIEEGKLKVWDLSQLQPRVIEGAGSLVAGGEDSAGPFWSPDGKSIAFARDGSQFRISATDGQAISICRLPGAYGGGAWGAEDVILIATTRGPMYKVSANGGDPELFIKLDPEADVDFHQPSFLPDGHTIVYSLHRHQGVDTVEAYRDGQRKLLLRLEGQARSGPQVINFPQFSATGHLLYRREQGNPGIWAVAFSPSRLEITGEPFLVTPNASHPSVAYDGTLVFDFAGDSGPGQLAWVNRKGVVEEVIGEPQENISNPAISPDGTRIAYAVDEKGKSDIWVVDRKGVRTRLTFSAEESKTPKWAPDGRRIIFDSGTKDGSVICEKSADGTGETKILAEKAEEGYVSPDGKRLIYTSSGEAGRGLRVLMLDGPGSPRNFLEKPTALQGSRISPDGRYVAYESWEGGRPGIYVRSFPEGEGQWQVATNQATNPLWNPHGSELFYLDNSGPQTRLMVVPVETKGQFTLGQAKELFSLEENVAVSKGIFKEIDVSSDGQRFVLVKSLSQRKRRGAIVVVQNWFKEFKSRKQQ